MKVNLVAAVNPSGPAASGVRSYVFTLARELTSKGVDVMVIGHGPSATKYEAFDFVSVAERIGSASEFILALALFLKRTSRLEGVVHANRPDDLVPFHLESPRLPAVLTLHGVHGFHIRARRGPVPAAAYQLAERYSLVRARAILCVSPDTLAYFRDMYPFLEDKFRMVPSGVDMDLFRIRSRAEARATFQLPQEHKLVAFIGRFEPEKNPIHVAQEFLALNQQHSDARLVMVGAGSLAEDLRRIAASNPGCKLDAAHRLRRNRSAAHRSTTETASCAATRTLRSLARGAPRWPRCNTAPIPLREGLPPANCPGSASTERTNSWRRSGQVRSPG